MQEKKHHSSKHLLVLYLISDYYYLALTCFVCTLTVSQSPGSCLFTV